LLLLAMSRPREALAHARSLLSASPAPYEASIAHQAAGIVLRDTEDVEAGIRELRSALRIARGLASREREADVLGSLGAAYVFAGRTPAGLAAFDRAVELSDGALAGRVLHRRGNVLWILGRHSRALEDFRRAVIILRRAHDPVWTARALNGRGLVYLALGFPERADADFVTAGELLSASGQELEFVHTLLNRGVAAFHAGDLVTALTVLDETEARYREFSVPTAALSFTRCDVLLAAGLAREALAQADEAVREIEQRHGKSTRKAELLYVGAVCALASAQPGEALARASAARRLFRAQQSWRYAHATFYVLRARYEGGQLSGRLLSSALQAVDLLSAAGSGQVAQARLLAGRIALALGHTEMAAGQFRSAARGRYRGPAISRVAGWLAEALRADAEGQVVQLQTACRRGLQILDEYRWTLGASELRAQATAHGAELAALAQRHAAASRRPRRLLIWSERWRGTALAVPAVRPPGGARFDADLAALRRVSSLLQAARRAGEPTATLERQQLRLEKAVRGRSLRTPGSAVPGAPRLDVAELLGQLGHAQLAEIVDVDGVLHVLLCGRGRVRLITAGTSAEARRAADFAHFALRRLARGRAGDDVASATAILSAAGPRLEAAVLGPATAALADGPLIVVPPGRLHGIPWALLPALAARPFSVAPSAGAWLRARAARPPDRQRVVMARGPGLVTGGAEVPVAAGFYPDVTVLSGERATAGRVLSALDGAWLAHVAAHGTFRADSPMFSSLRLHDGPLTVYDFEQLQRAPYRMVLSSCDSGVLAPAGADELLGLVSSLLPLGTAGIVAGVVPVSDEAIVPLMIELHRHLRARRSLAESLLSVRAAARADAGQHAAAVSLLAFGAA
jgi:tetratricopeptide (TPR) repeat protein